MRTWVSSLIAALFFIKVEGAGKGPRSRLQQGHAGLLWKICARIFYSSKAEVVGMKENSLWSFIPESMNSWAFYSSGMPGTLGWFYKAVKPQLKVWMNINHGGDDDSCSCFTQLSGGYRTSGSVHIAPCFPHLLWSAERGGYYLQACGTTVSTSFSAGIQGVGPCSADLVQCQHGMQLSTGLRHIPALCFPPPGCRLNSTLAPWR